MNELFEDLINFQFEATYDSDDEKDAKLQEELDEKLLFTTAEEFVRQKKERNKEKMIDGKVDKVEVGRGVQGGAKELEEIKTMTLVEKMNYVERHCHEKNSQYERLLDQCGYIGGQ